MATEWRQFYSVSQQRYIDADPRVRRLCLECLLQHLSAHGAEAHVIQEIQSELATLPGKPANPNAVNLDQILGKRPELPPDSVDEDPADPMVRAAHEFGWALE